MTNGSDFRSAIERMEEHEIIERLKQGHFSDEARPVAEAVLRERGIDPANPVIPKDQRPIVVTPKPWKPRLVPSLLALFAAGMAGRHIGAAMGGAIGAGLVSALFFLGGWWVGKHVALRVRSFQSKPARFLVLTLIVVAWIIVSGVVGILAQTGTGRIRP